MLLLSNILQELEPISLAEMSAVKLMNRIDTKYITSLALLPELLRAAQGQYYIQEIDGERVATYRTLYFDTSDLDMYTRHHNQHLVRQKVRIRHYADTAQSFLEVKRKNNRGRTKKKRIEIAATDTFATNEAMQAFVVQKSEYTWGELTPQLWTNFQRITLVNKAKTERLTIDVGVGWENVVTGQRAAYENLVIIEIKRDGNTFSPLQIWLRDQRIKPYKISKYCIGTALTNPRAKQNRFKRKIREVGRLEG